MSTCSWAYVAESIRDQTDFQMLDYKEHHQQQIQDQINSQTRKLDFVVVRYLSGGGKKMAKVKDRD